MITINYQPVLTLSDPSKIVFTDSAKSEVSHVYMDKFRSPKAGELVWMEIRNPDYNPNDPANVKRGSVVVNLDSNGNYHSETEHRDHADNPLYLFRKWMWVENLLSNHFPASYAKDAQGNPLTKPDGTLDLGDWDTQPGIVKLEMYEHKYVLKRQASLDNANILHRLSMFANKYNELLPEKLLNDLSWDDLASFLSLRKVKLDYGVSYSEDGDTLPSEYPPVLPYHCMWKQKTLEFCLHDLLRNFESRILSVTLEEPDPKDYLYNGITSTNLDEAEVLTSLKWRYRRPIEHRKDIIYEKSLWPVDNVETVENEENSIIYYLALNQYNGSATLYNPGYTNTDLQSDYSYSPTTRSQYDFVCNLYPYIMNYRLLEIDELSAYLKRSHVNLATEYQFTTKSLPVDFYEKSEWSNITLTYTKSNYHYLVEHKTRPTNFGYYEFSLGNFNALFKGIVKESLETNAVVFSSLVDITNNVIIDTDTTLPISDITLNPNDVVHGVISGQDFAISYIERTTITPDPDGELEIIDITFEGRKVDIIRWDIDNWNPAIPNTQLEIFDPATLDNVHNYVFEGFTTSGNYSYPFETLSYKTDTRWNRSTNLLAPSNSTNIATVHFVMKIPEVDRKQAIVDYLKENSSYLNLDHYQLDEFQEAVADKWLHYFERVEIQVGIHHNVTKLDFFNVEHDTQRVRTSKGIHPDLLPSQFNATSFPETFPGTPVSYTTYETNYDKGMPKSLTVIRDRLVQRYFNYLNSFDSTLSLVYLPEE